ncbi:von Willebrand factor A domain-containing protein DDB_G0267758-like [Rhizophagus irregularis DAOM 181602=DAOM 197198]|uniref:von willebrand domain-containing protein n=3 Tax=Rhizophagus irregularis TaxID=588596 RepID=A0A015IQL2_RHIIW|nr:hypothetical protein GLOIN_2v1505964 [Rhizophagus irregularis DAOM 181602=DAOM 197198]EXX59497.1 hypothetical protein RirG_188530 [Rhizophagus irregularis DAOM 197198w]POG81530.1 hypothetical protein GLOIN_2v1505964 [Rhizophagus irregularis DAOM 181602=DAOM 197198]GBC39682.1 von Willebrand factor A domain-containing protein DDB_G0267758-like [Rhizophagus irregularis DAOM 181602=DAOM 197198]|eukprot:XP_025188396.1 hypothetical protein GLOIN_2v1505964 [Rhizophagus irregularis DAOM 181602=DAOM 197198]
MSTYGLCFSTEIGINPIPLRNVIIGANIVDMIAEVTIRQTYKNVERDTIEAFYKFPIYEAAAICEFEAEIDGRRKIKGIVKESKEAAKEYTEAVQKGHGAYLLESESEDVFQCSVGNITSGQTVVIKITYVTELKHDSESEKIRFILPTNIAPRYGSSVYSSSSNDGKILKPDVVSYSNKADFYLDLTVTCRMTSTIQNIESPSHKISTEMNIDENPKISKITLSEQITYLEKDFILMIKSKEIDQPRAFVEYNPETETNCVMLTLVPKFSLNVIMSELVFIVDRSGSMGIEPMKKAAQALELLLHSLPENCYFNVISFGSRYDSLFPKSQLYSEKSLSKALNLAQTMTSNYGGTKIHNVLEWVFKNSRDDMPISVFLITDGRVWDADEIVELVRENEEKKKDDLRLFSLGIGDSVSHNLVESVARAGRGYAQFVTNDERMDRKVIEMLKSALKPPIKDYKITWTNTDLLELNDDKSAISFMSDETESLPSIKIQQAPYIIPPIYTGIRFMAYCILEKNIEPCKTITLKATSHDDRPMVLDIPLDPVTLQGSKIHRLAARKLIQDLDYKKSFIHKHPKNVGKFIPASFVKEHIVKLGKTYNLASKFTSFIAIDERNNEISEVLIKSRTIPQKRNVPQLAPQFSTLQSSSNFMTIGRFATTDTAIAGLATTSRINIMDLVRSGIRSLVSAKSGPKETKEAQSVSLLYSECGLNIESEFNHKESQIGSVFDDSKSEVNHKESQIENLFGFLELQSFDGKFLLNDSFYKFFYKNDLNDFINLKQEIIKEMGDIGIKEIEEILTTSIALAYLEIIIFKKFKDESELCYEKAVKALKKMVEDEEKEKLIGEKAKEWIKNWVINGK